VFEFLTGAISQEKEINGIQTRKEEVKLSLLEDNVTLYLKDLKDCTRKFLNLKNTFNKVAGYKKKSTYKNQ
jgi:hypothetical protein